MMDFADIAHGGYFLCYRCLGPGLEDRGEVWKDGKMRCGRSWREVAADWGSPGEAQQMPRYAREPVYVRTVYPHRPYENWNVWIVCLVHCYRPRFSLPATERSVQAGRSCNTEG